MSERNVPEHDSSPEKQQVEDTDSSHPDEPTEADSSENKPMEVAEDPAEEQEKIDADLKDTSSGRKVLKAKGPSKLGVKITSPTKSPVKVTSPVKGKRQSPSKPSKDVHSPSKKQYLEVITTDPTTVEVSGSGEFSAEKVKSPTKRKRQTPSESSEDAHSKEESLEVITTDPTTVEVSGSGKFAAEKVKSPTKRKRQTPSESSEDARSKKESLEVITTDQITMGISGSGEFSGVSRADPSDPSHVCVETCIHGGARPKTRVAATVHRSSEQGKNSRELEEMNRFAERMERRFSPSMEYFESVSQQEWARDPNVFAEELAREMGHGPFVHSSSNATYPCYYPSILQLSRMFAALSMENRNPPETYTPHGMDTEQEPHPFQNYGFLQQEQIIGIDQVPKSPRPMELEEELSNSLQSWPSPDVETEPISPMDQETPDEQEKAIEPREEPQQPRQEYRLMRLAMRAPQMGSHIINPDHPYRIRNENRWRTAMMTAYKSERYHSGEALDEAMSQLEREGVSQEEFFHSYHSARRIDLFRDEGVEEIRSEPEMEEMTIEDKINKIIAAVGFMTVAMLYMRLYIFRHPETETSSESSTMDSGNIDRSELEPQTDYSRLREHVNIELGSSDNTDSPEGIDSPGNNSPQEIQSPYFIPIPNRGSQVDVLVPLSQVPKRSDVPSSQSSLIVDSDGSSSSKKGQTLRRAVLRKCHSQSLDNTSGDASPILPDEEVPSGLPANYLEFLDNLLKCIFEAIRDPKTWEEEEGSVQSTEDKEEGVDVETGDKDEDVDAETKDKEEGVDAETGDKEEGVNAETGDEEGRVQSTEEKDEDDEGSGVDVETGETSSANESGGSDKEIGDDEDRSKTDPESQALDEDSKNEGEEEENMDQSGDVSMESASEEKSEVECAELKEGTNSASGSNVAADDSNASDLGDNVSRSGQSRKRKEHSNIEEDDWLAKRGKEH